MNSDSPASFSTSPRTAGRVLVDALILHGVDRVFCVPGESFLEVLDALYDAADQIDLVVAKHEGGAAHMAEADGKLTGRPGVCLVTRGPGATHASVGVHTAQQDSTPLILLVGQISRADRGRDAFQEVDYLAMFGGMAKWVVEVRHADELADTLARAFRVATRGRPGPVVVSLPEDMLTDTTLRLAAVAPPEPTLAPSDLQVQAIAQALAQARRPLMVVGGPLWSEAARADLQRFARAWQLPVACSFRRQELLDNRDPQFVGHLSLGLNPTLREAVRQADLILAIGTRLGEICTEGYTLIDPTQPASHLIHVHPQADELTRVYRPGLAVQAEVAPTLAALAALNPPSTVLWQDWTAQARAAFLTFVTPPRPHPQARGVDLGAAMRHLREVLPDDAVLTNGAGNFSVWLHRFFEYRHRLTQLAPTSGAMGYGLPAAVAAALRFPQREVVCVAGDGDFLMYPQELATVAQTGARLLVLVVNNQQYATIRMHQERRYPGRVVATDLQGPDFVTLARAFGAAHAQRVARSEDFAPALATARSASGFAVLELMTDPRQLTPALWLDPEGTASPSV